MKLDKNQKLLLQDLSNSIRILAADAIENAKSGHPGMPLGMADIMTVLAFNFLKFNPEQSKWFNRDRLVLSAGHGSMLLYSFYYLAGFKNFSLNEIKNFRKLNSKAAGHPENHLFEAIETTTGPLGQGFANSVGMAIAQKKYQARFGKEISDYKIYSIVGDGCLMEGLSYEAASLAGHLNLNNLIVIFDDNGISIDGKTSLTVSEDQLAKFKAFGFEVESIDGHDFDQIDAALQRANLATKPYFIACKTVIGKGADSKAGSEKSHGSPLGKDEIEYLKNNFVGSNNNKPFKIEPKLLNIWRESARKNIKLFNQWQESFAKLDLKDREYIENSDVVNYKSCDFQKLLNEQINITKESSRVSSGKILQEILRHNDKIVVGSADLSLSNNVFGKNSKAINAQDFAGNFIHYGVREHAMAGIMNGLALSGFLPISGTFFVFSDYMRPSIRLSAIMKNKVIYIMTHDSIGVGEDGPTHQPIEHLASFRAMPNLKLFRPADFTETLECYLAAMEEDGPSMLVLSRQNLLQIRNNYDPSNNLCKSGAYVISESKNYTKNDIVIFSSGSELSVALEVKGIIEKFYDKSVRVISVPCFENLANKTDDLGNQYLNELIGGAKIKVAIEAGSIFGWHRFIGSDGLFFGVDEFGVSAPANIIYDYFGLNADKIAETIIKFQP